MVSGTNFVVLRTELIKKLNVIEPEEKGFYIEHEKHALFSPQTKFFDGKVKFFFAK